MSNTMWRYAITLIESITWSRSSSLAALRRNTSWSSMSKGSSSFTSISIASSTIGVTWIDSPNVNQLLWLVVLVYITYIIHKLELLLLFTSVSSCKDNYTDVTHGRYNAAHLTDLSSYKYLSFSLVNQFQKFSSHFTSIFSSLCRAENRCLDCELQTKSARRREAQHCMWEFTLSFTMKS